MFDARATPHARRGMRLASLVLVLLTALSAAGQDTDSAQGRSPVEPLDPRTLDPFVGGVMAQQFASGLLAGAVVVVVQDGRVVLARGFGHADIERDVRVDPARTQFRIGSISKVFVYLAAMQQIALGRLQLDSPIAPLVPALPVDADAARWGGRLTLRHLVTHTAGFDEAVVGLFSYDPRVVRPLGEILARELPPRVRIAGRDAAYSNHGTALVAHVVERVSGQRYPDYVRRHVLDRLGLADTSFAQPPTTRAHTSPARGYRLRGGVLQAMPDEIVPLTAVGGMSSTGADMAKLMQELLAPTDRLAPRAQMAKLRERLHAADPRMPGMLFGLYESSRAPRVFGHGGDTIDFHADMRLYPEQGIGLFVAYNSEHGAVAKEEFAHAFEERLFPRTQIRQAPRAHRAPDAFERRIAGWYGPLRNSERTLARAALLFSAFVVDIDDAGRLGLHRGGRTRTYERIDRDLYRNIDDGELLRIGRDADGQPERLSLGTFAASTFGRVARLDTPPFAQGWFALGLLGLLLWVLATPRWWRAARRKEQSWERTRWGYALALLAGVALVFGALGVLVSMGDPLAVVFGDLGALKIFLGVIALGSVLLAVALLVVVWRRRAHWSLAVGLVMACVLLAWLARWNLLGFPVPAAA